MKPIQRIIGKDAEGNAISVGVRDEDCAAACRRAREKGAVGRLDLLIKPRKPKANKAIPP